MTNEQFNLAMIILLGDPWGAGMAADALDSDPETVQRCATGEIPDEMQGVIVAMLRERRGLIDGLLGEID